MAAGWPQARHLVPKQVPPCSRVACAITGTATTWSDTGTTENFVSPKNLEAGFLDFGALGHLGLGFTSLF